MKDKVDIYQHILEGGLIEETISTELQRIRIVYRDTGELIPQMISYKLLPPVSKEKEIRTT